jgi:hypothetical protein
LSLVIGDSQLGTKGRIYVKVGKTHRLRITNDKNKKLYMKLEAVTPADPRAENATKATFVKIFPRYVEIQPKQTKTIKIKCTETGEARIYMYLDYNDYKQITRNIRINMILKQGFRLICK